MLPATESPGRILCLLGMCVAFAGIGTAHLSQYFIYFDAFSNVTLHFAIAAIALGWAYLLPRHRLFSGVALMLAGMLAVGLWVNTSDRSLPPRGTAPVPQDHRELRVMWLNSWMMNRDQDAIAAEIDLQDPDIIGLGEVNSMTLRLARSLSDRFPYQYPSTRVRFVNMLVMSRYPMTGVVVRARWAGPAFIQGTLGPEWGGVTIMATHTIRAPRVNAQWNQINALAQLVQGYEKPRLIIGDFNASPYSRMTRQFASVTGLKRPSILPTWPATGMGLPQVAIDHMFADPQLLFPEGVLAGRFVGSDHLPIAARILVPVPGRTAAAKEVPGS